MRFTWSIITISLEKLTLRQIKINVMHSFFTHHTIEHICNFGEENVAILGF